MAIQTLVKQDFTLEGQRYLAGQVVTFVDDEEARWAHRNFFVSFSAAEVAAAISGSAVQRTHDVSNFNSSPGATASSVVTRAQALCESYERAYRNNVRVNATIPSASMAWGGTPAAGTIGYVNTGVVRTGYTETRVVATGSITNSLPSNGAVTLTRPFRLYGGIPHLGTGQSLQALQTYNKASTREQCATARLVIVTDEPKPIINLIGSSSNYIINVDDGTGPKRVHDSTIVADSGRQSFTASAAGGLNDLFLDFSQVGGRKRRIIEILMPQDTAIFSVWITATSTYYEPPESLKVLQITDSLGSTAPDVRMSECYVPVMQDYFGLRDWFVHAGGGTGFIADNAGSGRTHIEKLRLMLALPQLAGAEALVIQASVNDASQTYAAKYSAILDCLSFALANFPGIPVVALGPTAANTAGSQAQSTDTDTAMAAAVAAIGNPRLFHIPTMIGPLGKGVTGTGNINAPANNGNADFLFKSADGTHFAGAGHLIWGERIAAQLASVFRKIVNTFP